jgi:4-hydroxy-3-methylbut-2-enyl diphosphate reductase IspH
MKKSIKAIYAFLAGIVSAIVVALLVFGKKKQPIATPEQVVKNNSDIDKIEGKIEVIEEQREEIKNDIKKQERVIEDLTIEKQTIKPVKQTNAADAKDNILNVVKKSKRGRK